MMDLLSVTPKQLASTLVAVYLLFFILTSIYRACTSPLRHIPGPWHTRFSNIVLFWQVMAGQRSFYINSLHEKYGPTVRLSPTEADFMDAESFKTIHHVNSRFVKDPWYEAVSFLPRLTIFNERDPKSHGEHRKLLARHLGPNQIRQNFERQVRELCVLCIRKMRTKSKENAEVDLLDWARLVCSDILGQVVFGAPFGMLELEKRTEHIRVLDMALLFGGFTSEMPWLRTIGSRLPFKAFKEGYGFVDFIVNGAQVAVNNARSSADGQPRTVHASVLQEQRNNQDKLRQWDDTDIKVEASSLLIVGAGATATVLGFIWWQILELPDLRQSLETEVAALSDDFNDAMLETQCPLLSATILEGNRLWAGVPSSLPRLAPPGGCHLGGYFIPGGTTVGTQAYSMHRDATVWPDPLKLSPGRFLPGADIHPDVKSLPSGFGAGAYACLGPTLAKMNMRYMTAMLLKEFRGLKLSTKMGKLEEKNLITWIASFSKDDRILADFGEVEYRGKN